MQKLSPPTTISILIDFYIVFDYGSIMHLLNQENQKLMDKTVLTAEGFEVLKISCGDFLSLGKNPRLLSIQYDGQCVRYDRFTAASVLKARNNDPRPSVYEDEKFKSRSLMPEIFFPRIPISAFSSSFFL